VDISAIALTKTKSGKIRGTPIRSARSARKPVGDASLDDRAFENYEIDRGDICFICSANESFVCAAADFQRFSVDMN